MPIPIIEGKNIHRTFQSNWNTNHILKGIDISIEEKEFVAIMGKSGAGKSTLLYQLSALDRPTEGAIHVAGTNILELNKTDLTLFRLHTLGYVFQDYALIQDLSVLENISLPLLMRGIDWDTAEHMAQTALSEVGLDTMYGRMPTQLSGGEQQRVSVARAIAGSPAILFADEPTANLDSASGKAIIELLKKLNDAGQTIVMVTHEEEYAQSCDRIIHLEDGRIVSEKRKAPAVPAGPAPYVNPLYRALEKVATRGTSPRL